MLVSGRRPIPGTSVSLATTNAPGAVPYWPEHNATPSANGLISGPDQAKLNSLLGGGWGERIMAQALLYAPTLDNPEEVRCGVWPNGTPGLATGMADASIMGGALSFNGESPLPLTASLLANPSLYPWMVAFRGALPVPSTSFTSAKFGLYKTDFSVGFSFGSSYSADATHLVLLVGAQTPIVTAHVIDGGIHDYVILFDGSYVKVLVDGQMVGSTAYALNVALTTEALLCLSVTGSAGTIKIQRYGFAVSPTVPRPTMPSGCVLWVSGSAGVTQTGGVVSAVADLSGLGNNLVATGTPKLRTNTINGLPGFSMETAGDNLRGAARLFNANAPRHVFAVIKPLAGGRYTWGGEVLTAPDTMPIGGLSAVSISGTQYFYSDGITGGKTMTGTWLNTACIYEVRRAIGTNPSITCFQNGIAQSSGILAWLESDAAGFSVGNRVDSEERFSGYICELLAFARILTAEETTVVRSYLGSMYALTVG